MEAVAAILTFLDENMQDRTCFMLEELLNEIVTKCKIPELLLSNSGLVNILCKYPDVALVFLKRFDADRSLEHYSEPLMHVLKKLLAPRIYDYGSDYVEEISATAISAVQRLDQSKIQNYLSNSEYDMVFCFIFTSTFCSIHINDRESLIPLAETYAARRLPVTSVSLGNLVMLVPDSTAFQVLKGFTKSANEALKAKNESLNYLYIYKALQITDLLLTDLLICEGLHLILTEFQLSADSLLQPQDIEALGSALLRSVNKILDPKEQIAHVISLLKIVSKHVGLFPILLHSYKGF